MSQPTLKLEIAGLSITYRNAVELSRRIQERLATMRARRSDLERESKALRVQEKSLEQFLGTKPQAVRRQEEQSNG